MKRLFLLVCIVTLSVSASLSMANEYWYPYIENDKWWSSASDIGSDVWVVAAFDETEAFLDYDYDRIRDLDEPWVSLSAGEAHIFSRPLEDRAVLLVTSQPVETWYRHFNNNYGTYDDAVAFMEPSVTGVEFFIPFEMRVRIGATEDSTTVTIEESGSTDTVTLNQGEIHDLVGKPGAGTRISSDRPIGAVGYDYEPASEDRTFGIAITPTTEYGNSFWVFGRYPDRWYSISSDDRRIVFTHQDGTVQEMAAPYGPEEVLLDQPAAAYFIYDMTAKSHGGDAYRRRMGAYALPAKERAGQEYARAGSMLALEDGTLIEIDNDYDGVFEESFYLNAGETYNLAGPVPGDNRTLTRFKGHVRGSHPFVAVCVEIFGGGSYEDAPAMRSLPPMVVLIDDDGDGIPNEEDACPGDPNNDIDGDLICAGDGFKPPMLGDGDNCPDVPNQDQVDADADGTGDACDDCVDADGDGYGMPGDSRCPNGAEEDCDDNDAGQNPGVTEIYDAVDNDCDGLVDEGLDDDGDGIPNFYDLCNDTPAGYGVGPDGCVLCEADGDGDGWGATVDCDDTDPDINPGAEEVCNEVDDDCDGEIDEGFDLDGDGFTTCGGDCDDTNGSINPDALELPGNTVDENCDGSLGECDPNADWKNHGEYVRCVSHEVEQMVEDGLLTEEEGDALVSSAARADVGKKQK